MKKTLSLILAVLVCFTLFVPSFAVNAEKPFENSAFYEVGEYKLHYRTYEAKGEEKNQILLIHGFCLSTATFEGLAEIYAEKGYKTVLVDVPNFGYSTRETADMELSDREELIYSLMKHLGGKWIIGGHSMGGGIAINIALDYPESISGLVLFAPQTSMEADEKMSGLMKSDFVGGVMNLMLKVILKLPCVIRYALVASSFSDFDYARNYDLNKITDPFTLPGSGAGVAVMTSHTRGTDIEKFSSLSVPVVIITADKDMIANADNLSAIIENAPADTVVFNFQKGGHMMMEYDPQLAAEKTLPQIETM